MMNAKKSRFVLALAVLVCVAGNAMAETAIEVSVEPGKNWKTLSFIGVLPIKHAPQLAVWIEDDAGNFVKTLSATKSAATGSWRGAPAEGRPDSLPVWMHAVQGDNVAKADSPARGLDAVSSATSDVGLDVSSGSGNLMNGATYVIRLEVNTSFDYNDRWPKKAKAGEAGYSGVNGQPSLVYEGKFVAGVTSTVELVPVGTGSVDGSDGAMSKGFEGVTTALTMIRKATATVR